jgi:putative transposase
MPKCRSWEAASEAEWGLAVGREMVIRPLAQQERLSTAAIQDVIRRLGLSRSVLYDLVRRYRRRPQTSSVLPWKRGRGPRVQVLARSAKNCYRRALESST